MNSSNRRVVGEDNSQVALIEAVGGSYGPFQQEKREPDRSQVNQGIYFTVYFKKRWSWAKNEPILTLPVNKLSCTLLVDDDRINNFLNQRLLDGLNITDKLLTALNGQEALALFEQECQQAQCPALILLDVNMPVMNGFEFLEAYGKLQITPKESVIIIMLTTSLHPRDVERVQQLGIAGFINKPLTKEKVNGILKAYFSHELPQE